MLLQVIVTVVLAVSAYSFANQDRSPAPCGVPLPPVPSLITLADKDFTDASIMKGRIPEPYLQFMAPQPDGVMPLRYPLDVVRCNFKMLLPMGTTSLPMGDSFLNDAIDSQVVFKFDQQLDFIKISLPMREEGESVIGFATRARQDYEKLGAEFLPAADPLELNGLLFQHFEFRRMTELVKGEPERDVSHYVYFAPAGVRVLVMDFMTTPQRHEAARPLVEKMMRSIDPGERFLEQLRLEYPSKFPSDASAEERADIV